MNEQGPNTFILKSEKKKNDRTEDEAGAGCLAFLRNAQAGKPPRNKPIKKKIP